MKKENIVTMPVNSKNAPLHSYDSTNTASDSVPDIIFQLNADGRIEFISDSVKYYGYQTEELIKELMPDLVCDDDKEKIKKYLNALAGGIGNYESIEIGLLTKNKERIDFKLFCTIENKISASKKRSPSIPIVINGIAIDISNIKKPIEDISYKTNLQNLIEITRSTCHELSQPVTILLGYSEIILSNTGENDPLYKKLKEINNQADKIDEIIRRMHIKIKYMVEEYIAGGDIIGKI